MKIKIFLLLSIVSVQILGMNTAGVYITEVVNNTDEVIYLETSSDPNFSKSVQITKHISLKTGEEKKHLKAQKKGVRQRTFSLAPRTKNYIDGLDIPVVNPKWSRDDLYSYICMNFRMYVSNDQQPESFFGLRMLGDLLQLRKGTWGMRKISFNDEPCAIIGSPKRISSGSTLTVEINQLTPTIYHRYFPTTRHRLANNTLDIFIRENNISCDDIAIKITGEPTKAYIAEYKDNHGMQGDIADTISISVKFDDLEESSYLNKFCEFMERKDLIKRLAKISKGGSGKDSMVKFTFYSVISIATFQSLLDEANRAKLHLK